VNEKYYTQIGFYILFILSKKGVGLPAPFFDAALSVIVLTLKKKIKWFFMFHKNISIIRPEQNLIGISYGLKIIFLREAVQSATNWLVIVKEAACM
jgi:hypothetical protein